MNFTVARNIRIANLAARICLIFSAVVSFADLLAAQEGTDPPPNGNDTILLDDKAARLDEKDATPPVTVAEKRRKALAGLAAIGAIAILGVAVIAATMVWARRLRRLARNLGPVQKTVGNDFWFLKSNKRISNPAKTEEKPDGMP